MINPKAVVILSGGVDSTTLLYHVIDMGYDAYAISFDYGQKHLKELTYAERTCKKLNVPHKILDLREEGLAIGSVPAPVIALSQIASGYDVLENSEEYFNKVGYMGYQLEEKADTETALMTKVSDITLQMSAEDWLLNHWQN